MDDFYEIDFLNVESKKSGDAICIRYQINGQQKIHVVDGGFQATGDKVVTHINQYYNTPTFIDAVESTLKVLAFSSTELKTVSFLLSKLSKALIS